MAPELGSAFTTLLNRRGMRDQVFSALLTDLSKSPRPTVLVIEDAHWADEATLDLIRYLGRRVADLSAMLVVTYRDDEISTNYPLRIVIGDLGTVRSVRRMKLPPLSLDAVR